MKNKISVAFNQMNITAYRMLTLCLSIILLSLVLLCGYLLGASPSVLFSMWVQRYYIAECAVSAVTVSFGGAFLLDLAHKEKKR